MSRRMRLNAHQPPNDDFRKVAGNWTWPETGPHTVLIAEVT